MPKSSLVVFGSRLLYQGELILFSNKTAVVVMTVSKMQEFQDSESCHCNAVIDILVAVLLCMPQVTVLINKNI